MVVCQKIPDDIESAMRTLRYLIVLVFAPLPAVAQQMSGEDWSGFAKADVVVIGEVHDNPHHHLNQALGVAALDPGAIVFEMLTPELAGRIGAENRNAPDVLAETLEWEERGWPDFSMYFPIFAAAPQAAIFGGGLPNEDVRRATTDGAAAVFGASAAIFELDQDYGDAVQQELQAEQQVAHCNALPPASLPGMVEAQRLRDAALARGTLAAVYESRARAASSPVVVITGNGHARSNLGVPSLLKMLPDGLTVVSVGQFEIDAPKNPNFDYWMVTEASDRPDPCLAFK